MLSQRQQLRDDRTHSQDLLTLRLSIKADKPVVHLTHAPCLGLSVLIPFIVGSEGLQWCSKLPDHQQVPQIQTLPHPNCCENIFSMWWQALFKPGWFKHSLLEWPPFCTFCNITFLQALEAPSGTLGNWLQKAIPPAFLWAIMMTLTAAPTAQGKFAWWFCLSHYKGRYLLVIRTKNVKTSSNICSEVKMYPIGSGFWTLGFQWVALLGSYGTFRGCSFAGGRRSPEVALRVHHLAPLWLLSICVDGDVISQLPAPPTCCHAFPPIMDSSGFLSQNKLSYKFL